MLKSTNESSRTRRTLITHVNTTRSLWKSTTSRYQSLHRLTTKCRTHY